MRCHDLTKVRITTAEAQGPRSYYQDRLLAVETQNPKGMLFVVADGHRKDGEVIAQHCIDQLPEMLDKQTGPIKDRISNALYNIGIATAQVRAGTTCSAVHVVDAIAYVAFVGDSPVIIVDQDGKTVISPEHNVRTNLHERESACERGGIYDGSHVYALSGSGLQMGRAFGNADMGKVINREPEYYSVPLGEKSIIIVCSDGLLDPVHEHTEGLAHEIISLVKKGGCAETLMEWAVKRSLRDNAAVIVCQPR